MNGILNINEESEAREKYGNILEKFLQCMRKVTTAKGTAITDFQWEFGKDKFK